MAAARTNCRIRPSRQPRTISNKIRISANERKMVCQSGEPELIDLRFQIEDFRFRVTREKHRLFNLQLSFAAARDRTRPTRPLLRPSAPPAAKHMDRDGRGRSALFLHPTRSRFSV